MLPVPGQVGRQPAPEEMEHSSISMLPPDAGSPDLGGVVRDARRQGREIELLLGVKAAVASRHLAGLHPISADDLARAVLDQEMMKPAVELVLVLPRPVGLLEAFSQLDIEDL